MMLSDLAAEQTTIMTRRMYKRIEQSTVDADLEKLRIRGNLMDQHIAKAIRSAANSPRTGLVSEQGNEEAE